MPANQDSLVLRLLEASAFEWLVLVVSFLALAWLIFRVRSWFREDEDPAASDREMLLQFRDLHRRGDLSDEEYRSIKSRLINQSEGPSSNDSPGNDRDDG